MDRREAAVLPEIITLLAPKPHFKRTFRAAREVSAKINMRAQTTFFSAIAV